MRNYAVENQMSNLSMLSRLTKQIYLLYNIHLVIKIVSHEA